MNPRVSDDSAWPPVVARSISDFASAATLGVPSPKRWTGGTVEAGRWT